MLHRAAHRGRVLYPRYAPLVMPTVASRRQETLLQAILRHRRLSREQTVKVLYGRAREMKVEDFALSLRQLDRYLAGDIESLPRPTTCKVAEAEFGWPMEQLLSPFEGDITDLVPTRPAMAPPGREGVARGTIRGLVGRPQRF